ncbi:hypothetical protein Ancab_026799 [Ancistrocladus abbreviatus]
MARATQNWAFPFFPLPPPPEARPSNSSKSPPSPEVKPQPHPISPPTPTAQPPKSPISPPAPIFIPPPHPISPPHPHPIAPPPPPHIIPGPPPPQPQPGHHTTVIVVVFVSLGGLFFLAFLSAALCCLVKKRKKKMVQEIEEIDIDDRVKIQETVLPGPHGHQAVVLSIEEDIHAHEKIRKNERVAEGSRVRSTPHNLEVLDMAASASGNSRHYAEDKASFQPKVEY